MSTFMQYAMCASSEALEDAGWRPSTDQQREMTVSPCLFQCQSQRLSSTGKKGVCLGSGIGSLEVQYQTSIDLYQGVSPINPSSSYGKRPDSTQGPKKVSPLFVPKLLINLAAGHIAMKYGFKVAIFS